MIVKNIAVEIERLRVARLRFCHSTERLRSGQTDLRGIGDASPSSDRIVMFGPPCGYRFPKLIRCGPVAEIGSGISQEDVACFEAPVLQNI
jgi:hypothetical protein